MKNPAVFLDRDGTINVDKGYLYRPNECEYLDGAIEALSSLDSLGYRLIIVTNQSGIARGFYSEEDYRSFMAWMIADLKDKGINISGHYCCPHLKGAIVKKYDVECECRKPKTALFYRAAFEHDIDMEQSFAIGDRFRDLSICKDGQVKGILLGSGEEDIQPAFPYVRCADWQEALECIKASSRFHDNLAMIFNNSTKVILFDSLDRTLFTMLCEELRDKRKENIEIWHSFSDADSGEHIKYIEPKQMKKELDLYRLYEFSDRITVISDTDQYGGIMNYVKNGVMTLEEAVASLLYSTSGD